MKFPAVSSEAVQVGVERAFAIIERHHNPPEWRYRLGVRTEDSQSSNPGSIPGSATNKSELQRNPLGLPRDSQEIAVILQILASKPDWRKCLP
jgi:hypothetical protein